MFRNYLKVAFRNLWRNKGYSAINIFGLAIGLATCMLIVMYVVNELSYDRFYSKADRIYRVDADIRFGGGDLHLAVNSDPMGYTLKKDYPQVEEYTRIYASSGAKLIKKGNQFISEQNVGHVDSTFFSVFNLPTVEGDLNTALNEPNTVVITESMAKKYFGTTNAINKIIEADKTPYKITAVIKDLPKNTHIPFEMFFSMDNVDYDWGNFLSHNFQTYIVLKKGTDYKQFKKNLKQVVDNYVLPQAKQIMQINSMAEFEKAGNKLEYSLTPLTAIHLHSDRFPELSPNGNIQYVYIFGAVALFVLLIACVNFMNLSTARSATRAKEVGIRKVLGTERKTLVSQFLVESVVTVFIAMIIALLLAMIALPTFNDLSAKTLAISELFNSSFLPFIILLPLVVGLLAGSYPALYLSGFNPITVLKGGGMAKGLRKSSLRSVLVVFQFTTSIVLIIGTIIVFSQLHYIQTKKLGYNKDQVLIINGTGALGNQVEAFKNEVLNMKGVKSGTVSGFLPVTNSARNDNTFSKEAVIDAKNGINMQKWAVDYDYIPTMGMEMEKGRNFSKEFGSDSSAVIINETTAQFFGFDDPIGKKIYTTNDQKPVAYTIIGVVKNFNFESLRQKVSPLCIILGNSNWLTSFKLTSADISSLLPQIEQKWKSMAPGMPFSYRFLDESFNNMYLAERRIGKLALIFSVLAILIACLGLLGLVTYSTQQRIKEIGIRKVLGASVQNIVSMLSYDFLRLVIISLLIATPLAWWVMQKWLEDFAYRIGIGVWMFIVAALIAIGIAVITVTLQAMRAANANPVKNLRTE